MTLPSALLRKLEDETRLEDEDALTLLKDGGLLTLGRYAERLNAKKNGDTVGYVIDRNLNYTNVCVLRCKFCAFRRDQGVEGSWELSDADIDSKIEELLKEGGTQILMQGGHHPDFKLDYYVHMVRHIKEKYPQVTIHAFSPPELHHIAHLCKIPHRELLTELKAAGLDSIPGGGAEILNDRIRQKISSGKCSSETWLKVCETAHELGIQGSATMMFGHIETLEDRVAHLRQLRDLQDKTGGFFAFIPWTYVPGNSPMGGTSVGGHDYLKTLAVCRLYLDNFQNIQISWLTQGVKVAQIAMSFGGNDMGSTLLEENVVRSTGVPNQTTVPELRRIVTESGKIPRQRDTFYRYLQ
ncbi:MAG TPA: dehypoxanthine futalosine cyclase [Deltaproteobacteria bacterium]|nr:dehypoxanthine futalosine cyclase [Deltaproteobacteria bacterium]